MPYPETLCRLQLHKIASEQMHGDAALMEFLHAVEHQGSQEEVIDASPQSICPASHHARREPALPTQDNTKENEKCISQ